MKALIVLFVFALATYYSLDWLLDQAWNWKLIGQITVVLFSVVGSIAIGGLAGHGVLTGLQEVEKVIDRLFSFRPNR